MSTEQENFDDLLKSKLDESEFPFNEANWDKAEALIIQAEKKRKRRIIGVIFFIGMLLGVCVMIPFIGGKNNVEKKDLGTEKKNVKIDSKVESEVKPEIKMINSDKVAQAEIVEKSGRENEQIASLESNSSKENSNKEIDQKKEKGVNKNPYTSEKETNNAGGTAFAETKKSITARKKEQKARSEDGKNNDTQSIIKEDQEAGITEVNNNNKEVEVVKNEEAKNIASVKSVNEKPDVVTSISDSTKSSFVANNSLKNDSTIIVKDSIVKTKVDSVKPAVKDASEIFKKSTLFSIDAGANYAFGWVNNTTKEATGFNAVLGVSVTHQFVKKWSVLIGLQYNSLAHLSYSSFTSKNLQYDLGYNQTKTVITPTILYYLAVPIKLQYHFNEKNSLSIGVNTLYLLNTNSKVDTYTESTFGATTHNVSTKKGYMDGFSTWDLQPALAYRRRIIKCLSINAEIYYGLMDLKNNATFGLAKSEHNSGFKLTLSYNLLHK